MSTFFLFAAVFFGCSYLYSQLIVDSTCILQSLWDWLSAERIFYFDKFSLSLSFHEKEKEANQWTFNPCITFIWHVWILKLIINKCTTNTISTFVLPPFYFDAHLREGRQRNGAYPTTRFRRMSFTTTKNTPQFISKWWTSQKIHKEMSSTVHVLEHVPYSPSQFVFGKYLCLRGIIDENRSR